MSTQNTQKNPFSDLDPESLKWVEAQLREAQGGGQEQEDQAPQISATLPDGRQVTGTSEEVSRAFQEYSQSQQPQGQQAVGQTQKQEFNQQKFTDALVKDGREGMRYYFETTLGYDPGQVLGLVVQGLHELNTQQQELLKERFQGSHNLPPEEFQKVEKFVEDRKWQKSPQSFEDAYAVLKAQGQIKEAQVPQNQGVNPFQNIGANPTGSQPQGNQPFQSPQGQQFQQGLPPAQPGPVGSNVPPQVGQSASAPQANGLPQEYMELEKMARQYSTDDLRAAIEGVYRSGQ